MKNLLLSLCILLISCSGIQAQEKTESQNQNRKELKIRIKDASEEGIVKPDVYVDGKKFDFDYELIDPDKIESVKVVKGETAIKEYNAPHGVVLIHTKNASDSNKPKVLAGGKKSTISDEDPMIFINGKEVADRDTLNRMSPDDIESIAILKGEPALEEFNAPNGVILVTTKKRGKRKK